MAFKEVEYGTFTKTIDLGKKDLETGKIINSVTGYYLGSKQISTRKGPSTIHTFQQTDGSDVSVWGKTSMNNKLRQVPNGTLVKVEFKGKVALDNGNTMNDYLVQQDPAKTIDVQASGDEYEDPPGGYGDDSDNGYGETLAASNVQERAKALIAKGRK